MAKSSPSIPNFGYVVVLTVVMLIGNVGMSLFEKTIIKKV